MILILQEEQEALIRLQLRSLLLLKLTATELRFTAPTTPTTVAEGVPFTATVQATDANGNIDLDEASSVTITSSGGTLGGTASQNLTSGTRDFTNLTLTPSNTYTLTAAGGGLTSATTGNITVEPLPVPTLATVSDALLNETDGSLTLTFNYNVDMNTGVLPTVSFPTGGEDPSAAITATSVSFTNATTLQVGFTLTDANIDIDDIDVEVSGGQAQNTSAVAAGVTFTDIFSIDQVAPTQPTFTSISDDTGTPGDFVTADNTLFFNGTAEASSTVRVFRGGSTLIGTTTANGSGDFTLDNTASTIADGTYSITVTAEDAAGNISAASTPQDITILGAPPAAPGVAIADDNGASPTDFITSDNELVISGTAAGAAEVDIFLNGTLVATPTVSSGTYSFDYTGTTLTDGTYSLTVQAIDALAQRSAPTARTLQIETVAPTVAIARQSVTNGSFSGTNDNTLRYNITFSEAIDPATFTVADDIAVSTTGTASVGTATLSTSDNINFVLEIPSVTGDGDVSADVVLTGSAPTDIAGNSLASGATGAAFTVDNIAPAAPTFTGITTDTGPDNNDFITNDPTLSFQGTAEANATVELRLNGTTIGSATANGSGNFSFNYTFVTLGVGNYTLTGRTTDLAGNVSAIGGLQAFTIDLNAPAAPAITSISDDTGASNSDFITTDQTLIISGTAEADASVQIILNGTPIGLPVAATGGNFSFDYTGTTLAAGSYNFTATATDAAGNTSAASAVQAVVVDNTAPTAAIARVAPTLGTVAGTTDDNLSFMVTFNEAVDASTFAPADVTTVLSGTAVGSVSVTPVNATTFTVTLNTVTGNGTAAINVGPAIDNVAGLPMAAASANSPAFTVDNTPATVVSSVRQNPIPTPPSIETSALTVTFRVTFDQPVEASSVMATDFDLRRTGTAIGAVSTPVQVSPTVFDVPVVSVGGTGELELEVDGNFTDLAGNDVLATFTTGEFYEVVQPPVKLLTVVRDPVTNGSVGQTSDNAVSFTLTFNRNIRASTFTTADVLLSGTAVAGATVSAINATADPKVFTVDVSNISGDGTLAIIVGPDIEDLPGNEMDEAFGPSDAFSIDNTAPQVVQFTPADNAAGVSTRPTLQIEFDEVATVNTSLNLYIRQGGTVVETIAGSSFTGSGTSTITIPTTATLAGNTTYHIRTDAGLFADATGNLTAAINNATTWNFATSRINISNKTTSVCVGQPNLVLDGITLTENDPADFALGNGQTLYLMLRPI